MLKQHRSSCCQLLDGLGQQGVWKAGHEFFPQAAESLARPAIATAQRLLELLRTDEARPEHREVLGCLCAPAALMPWPGRMWPTGWGRPCTATTPGGALAALHLPQRVNGR